MPRRNRRLRGQTRQHDPNWPKARVVQLHREVRYRLEKLRKSLESRPTVYRYGYEDGGGSDSR